MTDIMKKATAAIALLVGLAAIQARGQSGTWTMVESSGRSPSIAVDPFDSLHVLAATDGGLLETRDGGAHWERRPIDVAPSEVVFDRITRALAFAACFVYGGRDNGVYVSTDGGATWSPTALVGPKVEVLSLAVGDTPVDRVFAAVRLVPGFALVGEFDVWSDDGGVSWSPFPWSPLPSEEFRSHLTPVTGSPVVYADSGGGRVARSGDEGETWNPVAVLPSSCSPGEILPVTYFGLAVGSASPDDVWATAVVEHFDCTRCGGLSRSSDGGATWHPLEPGQLVTTVTIDPVQPGVLYAGAAVRAFQACPGEPHTLLRSEDGGATWSAFDAGLGGLDVLTIVADPRGGRLYAGTEGGIFALDLPSTRGRARVIPVPPPLPVVVGHSPGG
jgi:photosystem II stability/assembly factor-like uncharacterized protein